jgi:hypothetical protein
MEGEKMKKLFIVALFITCSVIMMTNKNSGNTVVNENLNEVYSSNDYYMVDEEFDIVQAKIDLANEYQNMQIEMSLEEDILREETIHSMFADINLNGSEKNEKLLNMGVVYFDVPYAKLNSDSSDVTIGAVSIYYDYYTGSWYVSGSGYWNNDAYGNDADGSNNLDSIWNPAGNYGIWNGIGDTDNIGGRDSVGIYLQDTSTPPTGLSLLSGYGKFYNYDESKNISAYNYTRDINPSSYGAVYTFQDYLEITDASYFLGVLTSIDETYVAKRFYSSLRYNYKFAYYSGNAVVIYAHTWDKTDINSIGLGKDSFSVSWETTGDGWSAQSSSDTAFD